MANAVLPVGRPSEARVEGAMTARTFVGEPEAPKGPMTPSKIISILRSLIASTRENHIKVIYVHPSYSLARIKRELKSIEEKYGVSWERFYYFAEVSNNWKPLLEKATPEEILDDLAMLFELDEEYKKLTGKSLLKPLDDKWHGEGSSRSSMKTLTEMPTSRRIALKSPVFKLLWSGTVIIFPVGPMRMT